MSSVKFYRYEDIDEVDRLVNERYKQGWEYNENTDSLLCLVVKDPYGKKWRLEECIKELEKPLNFQNPNQKRALDAFEFYNLLFNFQYQDNEALLEGLDYF